MRTIIDLTESPTGVYTLRNFSQTPGEDGVLTELGLALPPTKSISHFPAFQRHDPGHQSRPHQAIGGGANRVQGLRITRWDEAIEGGLYAILELESGDWLTLLPIAGRTTMAWLNPHSADEVGVKVGNLGTDPVTGDIPVLSWSRADNLYEACQTVWQQLMSHPETRGLARQRHEKCYPDIFTYLGWCSWEQYKRDISSDVLTGAARRINESDVPVRFLLVDDGYFRHTGADNAMDNRLVQFGPDPEKFPQGWEPLLEQRRQEGIRWFGLWQNFNGYWDCIAEDNDLGDELNGHLMDLPQGGRLPKGTLPDATAWYEAMLNVAREGEFDFVKVDNQSANLHNYQGTGNAVDAATCSSQAFERAAAARVNGVINCMAHGPVSVSNTCLSAVTRCSEDYAKGDLGRAR
ncbi:MAG: Sip1-related alpha-galactosidase, partial [Planctomycetota bacterium]